MTKNDTHMKSKSELLSNILNEQETIERRHRELVDAINNVATSIDGFNYFMQETLQWWNPNPEIKVTCNHPRSKPRSTSKSRKA